ncbi:hypothetical protein NDU88_000785 [Pleurodeles waltl]|uniref:Uncharacterized protein n=1 Tax=Pleurodeles waltl TaxID=8319 RepID=A0AAV7VZ74_PLEWA|nr:hypothetical protein NDU88_000785 [Pleurodeles waltl]
MADPGTERSALEVGRADRGAVPDRAAGGARGARGRRWLPGRASGPREAERGADGWSQARRRRCRERPWSSAHTPGRRGNGTGDGVGSTWQYCMALAPRPSESLAVPGVAGWGPGETR